MIPPVTRRRRIVFTLTCPRCAARYRVESVREVEVRLERPGGDRAAAVRDANARLDRILARPMLVYCCPGCRRFGPGALSALLQMLGFALGVSILGAAGAALFLGLALEGPTLLFLVLGLVSLAAVPVGLVMALMIALGPFNARARLVDRYGRSSSRISQRSLPGA